MNRCIYKKEDGAIWATLFTFWATLFTVWATLFTFWATLFTFWATLFAVFLYFCNILCINLLTKLITIEQRLK